VYWFICDGSLLPISEYEVLFDLLGTTYGGDGTSTFALPDLRGRIPVHQGNSSNGSFILGQSGGSETVTLTEAQMPSHSHAIHAVSSSGNSKTPSAATFAASVEEQYASSANTALANGIVQSSPGGGQPHNNLVPYLCINFIIAAYGVFPSQD
jgi:microcystin-dependent protein